MQTILVAQYFEMCLEGFLCKLCFFGNFRIFLSQNNKLHVGTKLSENCMTLMEFLKGKTPVDGYSCTYV